jgi:hypothetical protein
MLTAAAAVFLGRLSERCPDSQDALSPCATVSDITPSLTLRFSVGAEGEGGLRLLLPFLHCRTNKMPQRRLFALSLALLSLMAAQAAFPTTLPSLSGQFMDDVIARRVKAAEALMSELSEEKEKAARVAEELAKQKPWTPPIVQPGGLKRAGEKYVNLDIPAVTPTRRVDVDAVGAR